MPLSVQHQHPVKAPLELSPSPSFCSTSVVDKPAGCLPARRSLLSSRPSSLPAPSRPRSPNPPDARPRLTKRSFRGMRIPIREQLGLLVLVTSLLAVAVISIVTWVNNYKFVVEIRSSRLSLAASLKSAQISSSLQLLGTSVQAITTRVLIQSALQRYNNVANNTAANWSRAQLDLQSAFGTTTQNLIQARVYGRDNTGPGGVYGLLNSTAELNPPIQLPVTYPNGTHVIMGDDSDLGYPAALYPNITAAGRAFDNATYVAPPNNTGNMPPYPAPAPFNTSNGQPVAGLLLGPLPVNSTFALFSVSVPIINNTSKTDVLGYITVVVSAQLILDVLRSREGLDNSGEALLVGPDTQYNRFPTGFAYDGPGDLVANSSMDIDNIRMKFVIPPEKNSTLGSRHNTFSFGQSQSTFLMQRFPAVVQAFSVRNMALNNAGSDISTTNEQNETVSVGYALPQSMLVDWALIVEETKAEAFAPINHLRNILLACVFGTVGFILLITFPIAHYSVRPIRRLKDATKESTEPTWSDSDSNLAESGNDVESGKNERRLSLAFWRRKAPAESPDRDRRRAFRIPSKVPDNKHFIHDELTELTTTYNIMTDELLKQYETLEDRVKERTAQLELSKKAAEAANESKTLFIANISHELKTPLNGILGMCAVCMTEDDVGKIRSSLKIVNESGELLLSLLNDLLTFSKHQIGHQITVEEREFRLAVIRSQILSIFDKQAQEAGIALTASFEGGVPDPSGSHIPLDGSPFYGPLAGKVENFDVWGDRNRILQVLINLVNNSLKFTPSGGSVKVRIKCLEEVEIDNDDISRRGSHKSKPSRYGSRQGSAPGSMASPSLRSDQRASKMMDTALTINPMDDKHQPIIILSEKSVPPPPAARAFMFEFEVEDTGPGIPENLLDRVFEPFVQGDVGLSKKFGGTGLGLSICSQLAKLMGGEINLRSEIGAGSVFTMRIPLKLLKEQAASTIASRRESINDDGLRRSDSAAGSITSGQGNGSVVPFEQPAATRLVGLSQPFFTSEASTVSDSPIKALGPRQDKRMRILVADDNAINQEVVLRMLKLEAVYDITLAKDGQEAFEKVRESMEQNKRFDLIFMDIQMPNLDGLQSTRQIRSLGYANPIVALTAFAEESNVKECMDSGMNYFLSKPIRRPALKHVLKTYCAPIPEEGEALAQDSKRSKTE